MGNHARLPASAVNWRDEAACRPADPAMFFGPEGEPSDVRKAREAAARDVCAGCPSRQPCLAFAEETGQRYGTWGGLSEDERAAERRRRQRAARRAA